MTRLAVMLLSTSAGCTPFRDHEKDFIPAPGVRPVFFRRESRSAGFKKLSICSRFSIAFPPFILILPSSLNSCRQICIYGSNNPYTSGQMLINCLIPSSWSAPPCWIVFNTSAGLPLVTTGLIWRYRGWNRGSVRLSVSSLVIFCIKWHWRSNGLTSRSALRTASLTFSDFRAVSMLRDRVSASPLSIFVPFRKSI